jgi:hypothetical protein
MTTLVILGLSFVGGAVVLYFALRANPNKAKKISRVLDAIEQ